MHALTVVVTAAILSGCASAIERQQRVQMDLERPVNCDTASADIRMLDEEKASAFEQFSNGVGTILPTSAVYNLLTGEFDSRSQIASGKYNDMLQQKIDQIRMQCMV